MTCKACTEPNPHLDMGGHLLFPGHLIFVDDRQVNVEAAQSTGLDGILFKSAADLEHQLKQRGLQF